jgi:hypothetical protein
VFLSTIQLLWQLLLLFACCSGLGLFWRFLIPKQFSVFHKVLFSCLGGLFLVVLIPQNLFYLGVPVRISAWLLLAAAVVQAWWHRRNLVAWIRILWANADLRTAVAVILLTVAFHGVVPTRQGLEWYYGKGHFDQINYVLLAEFLKDQPYSTSEQDVGLRPWLVGPVGFHANPERIGVSAGEQEAIGLKKMRIGQSIVTAEIGVWSGTDAKGGYAATVIFFLTLLAICLYLFLRETGIDRFMAGSGALLAALLPAVTRLSLDGFLSQTSILFIFPFFATLLRQQDLPAHSFTLFFSLTLAFVIAAYSEIAPLGLGTFFLGVLFVRQDKFRAKRLMLMSALLLIALVNPNYLRNLLEFLGQQYYFATNATFLDNLAPNLRTLHGWSELIFGDLPSAGWSQIFAFWTILVGILILAGVIHLSRRDQLVLGVTLAPGLLAILYLTTRNPPSYYPIAKITLSILPLLLGLVFVAWPQIAPSNHSRGMAALRKLIAALIVAAAAAGSVRSYSQVLHNEGLLNYVRDPRFLSVCRQLEEIKNKRVLVFENHPLLTPWLCYHARHNNVYFDGHFISDSAVPPLASFSQLPDLDHVDLVVTRDRIVDLRAPSVSCLALVDDLTGEDRRDGQLRYWLGPPAGLRFLAFRVMSANLKMRLAPGPEATTLPIDYFLADEQGHVFQGEILGENVEVKRMNLPRGFSKLELSVKAAVGEPNAEGAYPILAKLDDVELTDIDLLHGR